VVAVGKDANVAVQFDAPSEGKAPASFQGNLVAGTPGGLDCVLLFDGKEFRLEKLEGQVKSLRQIRNEASTNPTQWCRAFLERGLMFTYSATGSSAFLERGLMFTYSATGSSAR
jgi:hypothetical protein